VDYQKAGKYILIKKYSQTEPLQEFTASSALAIPVIENTDSIYLMDTQKTVNPDAGEVEDDNSGEPSPQFMNN
jgi:sortase (surface protein transpeptidase)